MSSTIGLFHYDLDGVSSDILMSKYFNFDKKYQCGYAKIKKYIDSGISFDYPINIRDGFITKNDAPRVLGQFIYNAWKSGIKALYYARIVAKNQDNLDEKETCVTCAN